MSDWERDFCIGPRIFVALDSLDLWLRLWNQKKTLVFQVWECDPAFQTDTRRILEQLWHPCPFSLPLVRGGLVDQAIVYVERQYGPDKSETEEQVSVWQ
jgi:hypothetical protein